MQLRSKKLLLVAAAVAMAGMPSPSNANGTPVIVSGPGDTYKTYAQPVAVIDKGDDVMFIHLDPTGLHDTTATQFGPDDADHCFQRNIPFPALGQPFDPSKATFKLDLLGNKKRAFPLGQCPIFFTGLIGAGQQYPLEGLDNVEPGETYDFKCVIHAAMFGKLVVLPEA